MKKAEEYNGEKKKIIILSSNIVTLYIWVD